MDRLPWSLFPVVLQPRQPNFQYPIHIPTQPRPYLKPLLPNRRIPQLPPWRTIDRQVMETDWESVYRSWKQGLGWKNRITMFRRCEKWLTDLQEVIWEGREWGRTANYVVPLDQQVHLPLQAGPGHLQVQPMVMPLAGNQEEANEEDMQDILQVGIIDTGDGQEIGNGLDQFQWPS